MEEKESKQRILDAAANLFGERGKAAVSTTEIAREAGVNKAMIFYYFGSKDELYQAALKQWFADMVENILGALEGVDPGLAMIEAFVRAHTAYLFRRPAMAKLIVRELLANDFGSSSEMAEMMRRLGGIRGRFMESLTAAGARGEIRDVDPLQTTVSIISMDVFVFVGKPIVKIIAPEIDIDRFVEERVNHILDLLMNGLRTRTE